MTGNINNHWKCKTTKTGELLLEVEKKEQLQGIGYIYISKLKEWSTEP